jgi:hypothetical protein
LDNIPEDRKVTLPRLEEITIKIDERFFPPVASPILPISFECQLPRISDTPTVYGRRDGHGWISRENFPFGGFQVTWPDRPRLPVKSMGLSAELSGLPHPIFIVVCALIQSVDLPLYSKASISVE